MLPLKPSNSGHCSSTPLKLNRYYAPMHSGAASIQPTPAPPQEEPSSPACYSSQCLHPDACKYCWATQTQLSQPHLQIGVPSGLSQCNRWLIHPSSHRVQPMQRSTTASTHYSSPTCRYITLCPHHSISILHSTPILLLATAEKEGARSRYMQGQKER